MSHIASLLVVDDEPEICEILVEYFADQGFLIQKACDSARARELFSAQVPYLAILDVRMPGEDGLSLARWIRDHHGGVGIIMLTTAADVVDKVVGLEIGADDYVPKPFDLRELLARVKSVLRRRSESVQAGGSSGRVRLGVCELDLAMHKLFDADDRELPLTAMEFDLLLARRTAFITGDTLSASIAPFLKETGQPWLEKPFSPEQVLELVAQIETA